MISRMYSVVSSQKKKNIQQLGGLFWLGDKNQEVILLGYVKKKVLFHPPEIFTCKRRFSWNLKSEEPPPTFGADLLSKKINKAISLLFN